MQLNLYSVSNEYIKYLRQFDERIYKNKEQINSHTRKYLGVVITIKEFNYYIPFSSPKDSDFLNMEKTKIRKSLIPIDKGTGLLSNLFLGTLFKNRLQFFLESYIIWTK